MKFRLNQRRLLAVLTAGCWFAPQFAISAWEVKEGPLRTRWAKDVSPKQAHPEYPRPQFVRREWLNLNGLWDFTITGRDVQQPESFTTQILVPYPVESALSGVMAHVTETNRLWYRRIFEVPPSWQGG